MIWLCAALVLAWFALGPWVLVAAALALLIPQVRWWVLDRVRITRRGVGIVAGTVVGVTGVSLVLPDGVLRIPPGPGVLATPSYVGRPASPKPVAAGDVPRNPHLAANGSNSRHNDPWATGAYAGPGPLGAQPQVATAWYGLENCATITFDSHGRLVALCGDVAGPRLHVIDPESRRKLATKKLPERQSSDTRAWDDGCGSAMYLDDEDQAVLGTTERDVLVVSTADGAGDAVLTTEVSYDLKPYVPHGDCLIALMPDWDGRIWWLSHHGLVGTIAPRSGEVRVHDLGEFIANSLALDQAGAYVTSEAALYRLAAGPDGTPQVTWRTAYDRGTAPTLLDDGVVAIADHADPQLNVVFLRRETGEEICRQPIFGKGASATETSLVSLGNAVLVENNHGYDS